MLKFQWIVAVFVVVVFSAVHAPSTAYAQSSFRGSDSRTLTRPLSAMERFHRSLWSYLHRRGRGYRTWQQPTGDVLTSLVISPTEKVKVFANAAALSNPAEAPHGSIIVQERYADDGATLHSIFVRYRSRGYNPAKQDWFETVFAPNGTVPPPPRKEVVPAG